MTAPSTFRTTSMSQVAPSRRHAWRLPVLLALLSLMLMRWTVPAHLWDPIGGPASPAAFARLMWQFAWLPRVAMALIAGAALALAGVLFQQVLRNPLAEPLTLGVSAGATLTMTIAAVWLPTLLASSRLGVAMTGACAAMAAVMALTWRSRFASIPVVLAGMIVNIFCGGLALLLALFYERTLTAIFIWGGGAITQNGWHDTLWLSGRVALAGVAAALLTRPLTLFALDDGSASQLGARVAWVRGAAVLVAVALSASVVSAVGMIGFVGLAAPALARLGGARRLRDQLVWAPLTGALTLLLTDQLVQCLPGLDGVGLPAGAAAALLGGPMVMWLLHKHRSGSLSGDDAATQPAHARRPRTMAFCALVCGVLLAWFALHFDRTLDGWQWASGADWQGVAVWRAPRLFASAAAGVLLGLAGTLLQRVGGNAMASPELLGVSGGALLGVLAVLVTVSDPSSPLLFLGAVAGALLALGVLLFFARCSHYAVSAMLLAGVAVSGMAQSIVALATTNGADYAFFLRAVLLGSTYLAGPPLAIGASLAAVAGLLLTWLAGRWLDVLPLGDSVASALGVNALRARVQLWCLAAALSAAATLVVGPLSFVGLLTPHLARYAGFRRGRAQALAAAIAGGLLMIVADWLGRNMAFPQQIPAGIIAMLLGAPYLLWCLRRQR